MNPRTIHQRRTGGTQRQTERTQRQAERQAERAQRRGAIILFVIVVLALLFIMGMASLMMATESRKSTEVAIQARKERMIHDAMTRNALMQLRQDIAR